MQDNIIHGRFLAELTKEVVDDLEVRLFHRDYHYLDQPIESKGEALLPELPLSLSADRNCDDSGSWMHNSHVRVSELRVNTLTSQCS